MESPAPQFQKQLSRIEELINALSAAPDSNICRQARELVQTLLQLHGTGFEQALTLIHESSPDGQLLIARLAENPLISNLLVLHHLHPLDLETGVRNALESVKPRLGLHGGSVELIGVTQDGGIRVALGRKLSRLSFVAHHIEIVDRGSATSNTINCGFATNRSRKKRRLRDQS